MAEDPFYLRKVYPSASSLFSASTKPLLEVRDTALVSFDTNVLLRPYLLKENIFQKISAIYSRLAAEARVVLTGHVAREFARHRDNKIAEIITALENSASGAKSPLAVSQLLADLPQYQKCQTSASALSTAADAFLRDIRELVAVVSGWRGDDPVSNAYRSVFTNNRIFDIELNDDDEKALISSSKWRVDNRIAPGFQDDRIGDLIIWKTILHVGETMKNDLIFVTNDQKNDWWVQGNGKALFPKRELIEEYREASGGRDLHLMTLAQFLAEFEAEKEVVDAVRQVDAEVAAANADNASNWANALAEIANRPMRYWRRMNALAGWDRLRRNPKDINDPDFEDYRSRIREQARFVFEEIAATEGLLSSAPTPSEAARYMENLHVLRRTLSRIESMLRDLDQQIHDAQIGEIY